MVQRLQAPSFTSYETACILNASEEEAHVEITIYFSHREPVSLFAHSSVSRPRAPNRKFNASFTSGAGSVSRARNLGSECV
jgi:hypothetical protein